MLRRKKVTWKAGEQPNKRGPYPHPHLPEVPVHAELEDHYNAHLVVGALWFTDMDMAEDTRFKDTLGSYQLHECPYLIPVSMWGQVAEHPKGTMAVYIGQVRVTEQTRGDKLMTFPRHAFLVGGKRYITHELQSFRPAF